MQAPPRKCSAARRIRLRSCVLASACAIAALLASQLHTRQAWPVLRRGRPTVCIASADPMLVPASRGTAEALWNLGHTLDAHGVAVHIIIIADAHETCLRSIQNIMFAARSLKASCAYTGAGEPGSYLFQPRAAMLRHLRQHVLGCALIISHEWWTPLQDILTERFFALGDGGSLPHTALLNLHGGAQWSRSWANASLFRYIDVVEDADERVGAFLADGVVFPTPYMRDYHTARWALPAAQHTVPNIVLDLGRVRRSGSLLNFSSIAFVGSVEERKGIDALLAVLASLTDFSRIALHIFGIFGVVQSEPADAYIAAALAAAPHVDCTVHGPVSADNLWTLLKRQNMLIVMPSLLENQPMVIINAYQHRVPVVCYDVGGVAGMLTPPSRDAVLIPPTREALRARLAAVLHSRQAAVPELSDAMFGAALMWRDLVSQHLRARPVAPQPLARQEGAASYAPILLADTTSTDELRAQLRGAPPAAFILLTRPEYAILPAAEDTLHALAQRLEAAASDVIAGVVGLVRLQGASLFPQPPFFLPSCGWLTCGPEVPLLVRRSLLLNYTAAFPGLPFRQWLFTFWLFNRPLDRRVVLRVPMPLFRHSGFIDPLLCFQSNQAHVDTPERILGNVTHFSAMLLPAQEPQRQVARLEDDFASVVRGSCEEVASRTSNGVVWLRAVAEPQPRLCNASAEHGLFTLRTLKLALMSSCGAYCVYPVGYAPPPPAASFGWGLETKDMCWQEVSSAHACAEWYSSRARTFPGAVAPLPVPPPAAEGGSASCGFMLTPEQHAPVGFCGPRLVVAHVRGCTQNSSGADHRSMQLLADEPDAHAGRLRYAQFWARAGRTSVESDSVLADHNVELAARLRAALPHARVAVFICDPAQRMWREFQVMVSGAEADEALRFLNISTFHQAVEALAPSSALCTHTPAQPYERMVHCQYLQRRLLTPGLHAANLYDWIGAFGRDNVLVLDADAAASENAARIVRFSNVTAPPADVSHGTRMVGVSVAIRGALETLFHAHNAWLARLAGDFPLQWAPP